MTNSTEPTDDEPQVTLRDRSPHPYSARPPADDLRQRHTSHGLNTRPPSRHSSCPTGTNSESGTEADDEKPHHLLRALPPAVQNPRKGLRGSLTPLLTANELDHEGQRFSRGYFDSTSAVLRSHQAHIEEERVKFEERQRAERIRRLCEALLLGLTGVIVVYGSGIWRVHGLWYLALVLGQVGSIAALVAYYPLQLVSVELRRGHIHIWSRFRIPPSFDPANILYPTFLPVLVAFSLSQQSPELILPSLMLGLASLPDRLFPRWSHAAVLNPLQWAVSIVPLVVAHLVEILARKFSNVLHHLRPPVLSNTLDPEHLVSLFALHRTLVIAIHYFSITSLLPAEKQLLSTSLIMLLYFATSPQSSILRSILWVGGLCLFVLSIYPLKWNVALSRVPTWRLQHSRHSSGLGHALSTLALDGLGQIKEALGVVPHIDMSSDSESDERSFLSKPRRRKSSVAGPDRNESYDVTVRSAGPDVHRKVQPLQRRNTLSTLSDAEVSRQSSRHAAPRSSYRRRDWRLRLNASQITVRKYVYSMFWYLGVVAVVAFPVRMDIARNATRGAEPILWAVDYMFGDVPWQKLLESGIIELPSPDVIRKAIGGLTISSLRVAIGPGNVRLLFIAYCISVLSIGLAAQTLLATRIEIDTRRKIFHGVLVAMLLPTIAIDPCLISLALTVSLGIISILELIRAGQVWPLGEILSRFLAPYVDGRDLRGPIVISHFFLLIGCAIPFWLSLATLPRAQSGVRPDWELANDAREVSMVAGVICVGMGDAAASLIGRRYGKRKWPWIGGKSLEGSAAFAIAVTAGLMASKVWLDVGGWHDVRTHDAASQAMQSHVQSRSGWAIDCTKAMVAASGASFMEAVLTGANDNVVVPIALWLLVRGLHL